MITAALVLQLSIFAAPPPDARYRTSLDDAREEVAAVVQRFQRDWRSAWDRSLLARSATAPLTRPQITLLHCHGQAPDGGSAQLPYHVSDGMVIGSARRPHFRCPSWLAGPLGQQVDEALDFDAMLVPAQREPVRAFRKALLDAFAVVRRGFPRDPEMFGLHLRLALDHGAHAVADSVVTACRSDEHLCALADGLVGSVRGDALRAEAAFSDPRIPASWYCADREAALLFGVDEAARWDAMDCAGRRAWLDTLWWLSDPFWAEPGNPRRTEHHARRVALELRALSFRDERFVWDALGGGDALRKAVLWYGWPTVFAAGEEGGRGIPTARQDYSHSGWLVERGYVGANPEPYTTLEYSRGRVALLPPKQVRADPFAMAPGQWRIAPPRRRSGEPDTLWWPDEHWRPPQRMDDIGPGQVVFLRRDSLVEIAAAHDLRAGDVPDPPVSLIASAGPGDMQRVASVPLLGDATTVLRGQARGGRAMYSLEVPRRPPAVAPALRARWGAVAPPPLIEAAPGSLDVSMPALFALPADGRDVRAHPDSVLPRLLGSTVLNDPRSVGLYWETYGVGIGDSLEVAVWLERFTGPGVIRQLGIAFRVAEDLNTPIAVVWQEPRVGSNVVALPGLVPVVGRATALDLSGLVPGEYRVEVAIARPGQAPVRGRSTVLEIRR